MSFMLQPAMVEAASREIERALLANPDDRKGLLAGFAQEYGRQLINDWLAFREECLRLSQAATRFEGERNELQARLNKLGAASPPPLPPGVDPDFLPPPRLG